MTNTIRHRYQNDPHFHNLVDLMLSQIQAAQFTPTEIREAAMLAQIMYEDVNPRPVVFSKKDVMDGLPERLPSDTKKER